uniref:Uncharacterized protein n=1 Tax=Avena sativa TaxID=4498 RepID=A0ACD5UBW1_AVESA
MAGGRRASLQLPSVSALLLLCIFSSSWGHAVAKFDPANMTALQKHVSFFDRNKDGIITPTETFEGFVAVGCEIAFSTAAATTVHTALALKTTPAGTPPPYLNIYVENIHKAIHGGDTGVYDAKGRAPQVEWGLIYTLASDWLGFLHKDDIRGIYDGSVFTKLEEKRKPFSDM